MLNILNINTKFYFFSLCQFPFKYRVVDGGREGGMQKFLCIFEGIKEKCGGSQSTPIFFLLFSYDILLEYGNETEKIGPINHT